MMVRRISPNSLCEFGNASRGDELGTNALHGPDWDNGLGGELPCVVLRVTDVVEVGGERQHTVARRMFRQQR